MTQYTYRRRAMWLVLCAVIVAPIETSRADGNEAALLSGIRQLTFEGKRSGEGYFSADGRMLIFQSEREPDNPFFQIYLLDLTTGDTRRISPGVGKTTCAWIHPAGDQALFASTQDDPDARKKQRDEIEFRQSGKSRRYSWDFDEHFEIYEAPLSGGTYRNLTKARGYDAEGSYSPDGKRIVFASNRHAYTETLSDELRKRLQTDPSYFLELYVMDADGANPRRLTDSPGYDGGPFFSADGERICWRRFSPDGATAEIWTAGADGSDQKQITRLGAMSWAPYFHPSGDYLIFTTNLLGFSNFELYLVDADGKHEPVRVTYTDGFDGLPVFHPDGKQLAWTSNRTSDGSSQVFLAEFDNDAARRLLEINGNDGAQNAAANAPDSPAALAPTISAADLLTLQADYAELRITGETTESKLRSVAKRIGLARDNPPTPVFKGEQWLGGLSPEGESAARLLVVATDSDGNGWPAGAAAYLTEIAHFLAADAPQLRQEVTFSLMRSDCESTVESSAKKNQYDAVIEMVCRAKPDRTVHVWGSGTSSQWRGQIERRNVPVGLPLNVSSETEDTCAAQYAGKRRIPCLQIEAGPIARDEVVAGRAELVARLTALIARAIARSDSAIQYKAPTPHASKPQRPYLGTEPDYAGGGTGVKINVVTSGGPADAGGMMPGDVIIEIDGQPIDDVMAYAKVLDTLTVDQIITVTVRRGGEDFRLSIKVGGRS